MICCLSKCFLSVRFQTHINSCKGFLQFSFKKKIPQRKGWGQNCLYFRTVISQFYCVDTGWVTQTPGYWSRDFFFSQIRRSLDLSRQIAVLVTSQRGWDSIDVCWRSNKVKYRTVVCWTTTKHLSNHPLNVCATVFLVPHSLKLHNLHNLLLCFYWQHKNKQIIHVPARNIA